MALPNSNISVAMVKAELGASTNDIGRLCIHPNVNKWSKWKPIRHHKLFNLNDTDFQNKNYGLNVQFLNASEAKNVPNGNWDYYKPRGGVNEEYYRLDDFRNYNHSAGKPIYFTINSNEIYEYNVNTMFSATGGLPALIPIYKNSTSNSMGSLSDIPLSNFLDQSGINIADCVFCVTTQDSNGNLLVANSDDTISCKFGTLISNNAIHLSKYTLDTGFINITGNDSNFPEGATERQMITLHPRINLFKPSSLGQVRNNNGSPTSATGFNGYYLQGSTSFMTVPCNPIIIRKYKYNPIAVTYSYTTIYSNTEQRVLINTWAHSVLNSGQNIRTGIGGTVIGNNLRFQTIVTFTNTDTVARTIYPARYNFNNNTTSDIQIFDTNNNNVTSGVTIPAGGNQTIRIDATFTNYPSYTFPTISSPNYGQLSNTIEIRLTVGGSYMVPKNTPRQMLAWR